MSLAVRFIMLALRRAVLHPYGESRCMAYFLLAVIVPSALIYQAHPGGSMTRISESENYLTTIIFAPTFVSLRIGARLSE